jgi:hypothetical protein
MKREKTLAREIFEQSFKRILDPNDRGAATARWFRKVGFSELASISPDKWDEQVTPEGRDCFP